MTEKEPAEIYQRKIRYSKRELIRIDTQLDPLMKEESLDTEQIAKLESYVELYKNELDEFRSNARNYLELLDYEDKGFIKIEGPIHEDLTNLGKVYHNAIAKLVNQRQSAKDRRAKESIIPPPAFSSTANQTVQSSVPKLPKIDIPKFNGEMLAYRNFKALWENLIHNDPDIPGVQKLYFLNQSVKNTEMEEIIGDFPLTDNGYIEAWNCLEDRFNNKRLVVRKYFANLTAIEPIKYSGQIRDLLNKFDAVSLGLKAIGEECEGTFSKFLCYFLSIKLDKYTARDWENSLTSTKEFPSYKTLHAFLRNRSFAEDVSNPKSSEQKIPHLKPNKVTSIDKKNFAISTSPSCHACPENHLLIQCPVFGKKSTHERYKIVKSAGICINCFRNHPVKTCNQPPCKICKSKHNTLLHHEKSLNVGDNGVVKQSPELSEQEKINSTSTSSSGPVVCALSQRVEKKNQFVLLPTAVANFECGNKFGLIRIMLDSCSQSEVITDSFIDKYNLPTHKTASVISGIGGQIGSSSVCSITLKSRVSSFELSVEADVVPSSAIKYEIPVDKAFISREVLNSLKLADEGLNSRSIDLILGNRYYESCQLNAILTFEGVVFRSTQFGWAPTGPIPNRAVCNVAFSFVSTREIRADLARFWEIEEVGVAETDQSEHKNCENHFLETHSRNEDGRFVVRLPFKDSPELLGESRTRAHRSLMYSERKSSPEIRAPYISFMEEYESLQHMTKIPTPILDKSPPSVYYINHHAVLRPTSTTTKLRVVFNASAPTVGGPSLNQLLMCGPKVQPNLFEILISFRDFLVAFSADINKMYRQVLVHENDRDFQRILWRADLTKEVSEYRLNTLTYGFIPASYIAQKCLEVIADSIKDSSPSASLAIKECFYMDDLLTGSSSIEGAIKLQQEIQAALLSGQFPLRKYISNSVEFLESLDPSLVEESVFNLVQPEKSSALVLGLVWDPKNDVFRVKPASLDLPDDAVVSQKMLLSVSSRIFDPLGFLSPVSIRFKFLLQEVWKEKLNWDEPVSDGIRNAFIACVNEIKLLSDFTVRRPYSTLSNISDRLLVGFCDASLSAFCAAVYLQTFNAVGETDCYLVCSKTKVTPLSFGKSKGDSEEKNEIPNIHRLELMGAELLSKLMVRVARRLKLENSKIRAYSDSKVTLCWLAKPPQTWKIFVSNRVRTIQSLIPHSQWSYVPSKLNPADLPTRGISASRLLSSEMWLFGPDFLRECVSDSSNSENFADDETIRESLVESKVINVIVAAENDSRLNIFEKSSNFSRLQRAVARIIRWSDKKISKDTALTPSELSNSFVVLVKCAQSLYYSKEISALKNNMPISKHSPLKSLCPILDKSGVLRASGRLLNSDLSYAKKYPIIMNSSNPFVLLYANYIHRAYFHAGAKFISCFLESRFRFVGGVSTLSKNIIRKCVVCARFNRSAPSQLMGQLPRERITVSRPFTFICTDFAGPFDTKCVGHRSTIFFKSYLCVFVCLATRAVYLDTMSSLETEDFLSTFHRFAARRGVPKKIWSDNGTTFKKARKVLNIEWEPGPAYGPHHQGLAEAAVKSSKRSLSKVTKCRVLTFEEYTTLFAKIEAVLNSRPLCRHSDGSVLTPGHFLSGSHLLLPDENPPLSVSLSCRHKFINQLFDDFWSSWSKDYINQLSNRTKWFKTQPNVKVGEIVLVRQKGLKAGEWPLARIHEVLPGSDGLVRKVIIKMNNKFFQRPITNLVPLPVDVEVSVVPSQGDCL